MSLAQILQHPSLIQGSGTQWNGKTYGYCLSEKCGGTTQGLFSPIPSAVWCLPYSKLIYAGNIPYLVLNSMIKTSVLLFYLRLFGTPGTRPGFRKLLFATQTLVVLWFLGSILPGIFRCHPIHDSWNLKLLGDPDVRHDCINDNTYYISTSVFNVALDLWILLLPISIIWTLQLSARRKVGLSAIFLLGGLYVPCAPLVAAVCICSHSLLT